jgi:hypothetical protein
MFIGDNWSTAGDTGITQEVAGPMNKLVPVAKKLVVGAVAVGALAVGTVGVAGAATTTTPRAAATFNCARADRVLTRIQKGETRIAAGLPKLTAAEAKATAAGRTKLAAGLQKRITRLESSQFTARLDRLTAAIEAKCPSSAPSSASTSSTPATAS